MGTSGRSSVGTDQLVRQYPVGGLLCPSCQATVPEPAYGKHCPACGWDLSRPSPRRGHLEHLARQLLTVLGEDPDREGLRQTPRRWADMWMEFITYRDANATTTFEMVRADQLVVVRGMRIWSICEHHLLPFACDVAAGYITRERVLGLSKFARLAHVAAHRLQLQERLVEELADALEDATGSHDVAVLAKGRHLCMEMRGVKTAAEMVTSVLRGSFRDSGPARHEFMHLTS